MCSTIYNFTLHGHHHYRYITVVRVIFRRTLHITSKLNTEPKQSCQFVKCVRRKLTFDGVVDVGSLVEDRRAKDGISDGDVDHGSTSQRWNSLVYGEHLQVSVQDNIIDGIIK